MLFSRIWILVRQGLEQENLIFLFVHQGTEIYHREFRKASVESAIRAIVLAVAMVTESKSEMGGEGRHGA